MRRLSCVVTCVCGGTVWFPLYKGPSTLCIEQHTQHAWAYISTLLEERALNSFTGTTPSHWWDIWMTHGSAFLAISALHFVRWLFTYYIYVYIPSVSFSFRVHFGAFCRSPVVFICLLLGSIRVSRLILKFCCLIPHFRSHQPMGVCDCLSSLMCFTCV